MVTEDQSVWSGGKRSSSIRKGRLCFLSFSSSSLDEDEEKEGQEDEDEDGETVEEEVLEEGEVEEEESDVVRELRSKHSGWFGM